MEEIKVPPGAKEIGYSSFGTAASCQVISKIVDFYGIKWVEEKKSTPEFDEIVISLVLDTMCRTAAGKNKATDAAATNRIKNE